MKMERLLSASIIEMYFNLIFRKKNNPINYMQRVMKDDLNKEVRGKAEGCNQMK